MSIFTRETFIPMCWQQWFVVFLGLLPLFVHAVDTDYFSLDIGQEGELLRMSEENNQQVFTLANPAKKLVVLVSVNNFSKPKDAQAFVQDRLQATDEDIVAREEKLLERGNSKQAGCEQYHLAYLKPVRQTTSVDFYLSCKRRVIVANYALAGMQSDNVSKAKAMQKTFRLR
ncbi:MAG: hypothetical protein ACR2PS_12680 [Pseudomonadales bacterium]